MAVKDGNSRITVTVDEELLGKIEDVADEMGVSVSKAAAWLIEDRYRQMEKKYAEVKSWATIIDKMAKEYALDAEGDVMKLEDGDSDEMRAWKKGYMAGQKSAYGMCAQDLRIRVEVFYEVHPEYR